MRIKQISRRMNLVLAAISLSAISIGGAALFVDAYRSGASAQDAQKLEDSVVFAMTGGSAQEVLEKCASDDFTKKYNVRVDFLSIQSQAALARVLTQRNNPSIDVMWSIPATEQAGFKEGVFVPTTPSLVPNVTNIDPKFAEPPGRGALLLTTMIGIQYNTEIFKEKGWEPPTSWRDLWDPKYKGRVAIAGLSFGGTGIASVAVAGFLNGGDPKNFDAAFEYLAKLKPNLYTIFQQAPQYDAAMLDGRALIGISSAGRPLALKQQGAPISFVQPSEGVIVSNTYLSILKGAPHPNAALAFTNWMLSKEAQACLPRAGYAPVVKGVEVSAELASFLTVQRTVIPIDWVYFQEKLPELLKRWNKEIDG